MKIINTPAEWKAERKNIEGMKTGFVPTMGGLHKGHLSLIKKSIEENEITIVSVFLNPTQFNDKKDLETYPSNREDDIKFLENAGVDYAFMPDYETMYPDDYAYMVVEKDFSHQLCGASRPGHFDGVLSVVMKLFNIIRPDTAYFGEKDYQQFQLIKGMTEAFFMDINLVSCPIIRQESGLALSSRNNKLSEAGLKIAPEFYKILKNTAALEEKKRQLEEKGFAVDYLTERKGRLYAAVFLEGVRLIDNVDVK